jgi:hypothetical protein
MAKFKVFNPEDSAKNFLIGEKQYAILGRNYIVVEESKAKALYDMWHGFEIVEFKEEAKVAEPIAEILTKFLLRLKNQRRK